MRAVRFTPDGVVMTEAQEPRASEGHVRVRVVSTGICGSDLGFIAAGGVPVIPGHEISGVTDDGRNVAVQPNAACESCELCQAGRSNLCTESMAAFSGMAGVDGGFAEYVLARPHQLHELPDGVPVELGALAEPAAVAWHALKRLAPEKGSEVLVVGAGSIGLLAGAMLSNGHRVSLVTRHEHQREAADALGIPTVAPEEVTAADYVLDSAGGQSSLDLATEAARPGGAVVALGAFTWKPSLSETVMYKELDLRLSLIYTGSDFADALDFLDGRRDIPGQLVTHHFDLEHAVDAFAAAGSRGRQNSIKVLVHPAAV